MDDLPFVGGSDFDGHAEGGFVGLPAVGDGVAGEFQFEFGDGGVAEVLVEDGGEVHAGPLVDPGDHVFGHDVLIFEMLEKVVDEGEPFAVVAHDAAEGVKE